MLVKKIRDFVLGTTLGIVFCLALCKVVHPEWSVVYIIKLIVWSQTGWSW